MYGLLLAVIYIVCLLMAETLQHNAAAAIMFATSFAEMGTRDERVLRSCRA